MIHRRKRRQTAPGTGRGDHAAPDPSLSASDLPTIALLLATASDMTANEVNDRIQRALPGAQVQVRSDDNVHFEALVVAPQFDGLRTIKRHQLVYAALGEAVGGEIHALSLDTPTPAEWAARSAR